MAPSSSSTPSQEVELSRLAGKPPIARNEAFSSTTAINEMLAPSYPRDKTSSADATPWNTDTAAAAAAADAAANPIPGPYTHLPDSEAAILKRQVETHERKYSIWHLYRYATKLDILIVIIAAVASCASGAALPLMTIIFGGLQGTFQDYLSFQKITKQEFQREITGFVLYFVYLAIGSFFATYISIVGFLYTGEHITTSLRQQYLESCLRQNIAFFDNVSAGDVAAKITLDANKIQDGISEKIGLLLASLATLVTGFLIGFIVSWKLTLIMSSVFIALLLNTALWGSCVRRYTAHVTQAAVKSSTLAQEVFSAIRIAIAFGSQQDILNQYDSYLKASQSYSFRIKAAVAMMLAVYMGIMPLTYGLGFWQGSLFLAHDELRIEKIVTTILAVIIGSFNIGTIGPYLQALIDALSAASRLMVVIDRQTPLDATDDEYEKPLYVEGNIRFEGIKHIYPSRPETVVLDGLNIDIPAGKVTALVGASGSGKSTIIGLIERFYEPVQGVIFLDGRDISKLNTGWLRRQIGVVGQEPVLFSGSILDNIRHGLIGSVHENADDDAQTELIITAAKISKAHEFISQLADGYATDVGQRGLLLSGGQKQRIAIARAIVSNPKILLLDEATSALDTKSEAVVQSALDQASLSRTTVIIAHRLSTVRNADTIILLSKGKVVEQGSHDQLLERQGAYYELVTSQSFRSSDQGGHESSENKVSTHDDLLQEDDLAILSPSDGSRSCPLSSVVDASVTSTLGERETVNEGAQYSFWTLFRFILSFNNPEKLLMSIAFFFCTIGGLGTPVQAVFFAKQLMLLSTIGSPLYDRWEVQSDSNFWSLMFLMLGIVSFMAYAVQSIIFAFAAEALIRRVKRDTMRHILRQDVSFFDQSVNSSGALTAFLALETMQLTSMSGNLGHLVTSLTIIVGGVSLSLAIGWKLALVCLSVVSLLICCSILRFFILRKYEGRASRIYMQSAAYATEHIAAIRTVASLTLEGQISDQYRSIVEKQRRRGLVSIAKSGAIYAASQSVIMLCLGLSFWYGSTLIVRMEYDMFQFFVCLMSVVFGAQSAGMMLTFIPDIVKARQSATRLKVLFDSKSGNDNWDFSYPYGQNLEQTTGLLEFQNVHFRYPTRPEKPVLRGLNLTVHPGQHVALVGASGCGKSTVISLLERFYDPCDGQITIDKMDISSIPIKDYRSQFALVSQEPALFQGTIRDNISLGSHDETISDQTIETACREANIHDFIVSLPDGLNTDVGGTGVLLSGGQKQRIAIARAIVRRSKVLLLDEATSALDSESEHVVQASLSHTAKGRTTITVAHRLTSVINADKIFVLDDGCIVESGTHQELTALGGRYAELAGL